MTSSALLILDSTFGMLALLVIGSIRLFDTTTRFGEGNKVLHVGITQPNIIDYGKGPVGQRCADDMISIEQFPEASKLIWLPTTVT